MYAAKVGGQSLTFDAEAVWRRNMIMRDRETGTLWQHVTGQAYIGPLVNRQLEVLGGERTTWGGWKQAYPESLVSVGPEKWPGLFPLPLTLKVLETATRSGKVPGFTPTDGRLPQNEEIIGVTLAGDSRAFPMALLQEKGIINGQVGGISLVMVYQPEIDQARVFKIPGGEGSLALRDGRLVDEQGMQWDLNGKTAVGNGQGLERLSFQRQWWSAWYEFHPGTTVYAPNH